MAISCKHGNKTSEFHKYSENVLNVRPLASQEGAFFSFPTRNITCISYSYSVNHFGETVPNCNEWAIWTHTFGNICHFLVAV
jgi:hypothetical protein